MTSSVVCHTTKILKYIDHVLQPHVKELRSYVKSSTDFKRKINNLERVFENSTLQTMDTHPLYTNIPNNEGIIAVETTLKRKIIAGRIITTFFHFLTLNNFLFNCQIYLQFKGWAMGTKCAPNYANIFMDIFEKKFIYPLGNNMTRLYLQFTSDVFIKWTGTLGQLLEFKQRIEEIYPSIKFDFKFSNKEIKFLNTVVCKTPTGKLDTNLCTKNTDRQTYLQIKTSWVLKTQHTTCTNLTLTTYMYS